MCQTCIHAIIFQNTYFDVAFRMWWMCTALVSQPCQQLLLFSLGWWWGQHRGLISIFLEICRWRSLSFSLSVPSFLMWSLDWTWYCFTDVSSWFFMVLTFSFNALICEDIKLTNVLPSVKDVERKIFGSDDVILICCRWACAYSNWHAGKIFLKHWTQQGRLWLQ